MSQRRPEGPGLRHLPSANKETFNRKKEES